MKNKKQFNGHLKGRSKGEFKLTLPLPEPLLQLLEKSKHRQNRFLFKNDKANKNDLIMLNIKDHRLCALGYSIVQKSMNDMLKNICKQVGIDSNGLNISVYTCRHTVTTK